VWRSLRVLLLAGAPFWILAVPFYALGITFTVIQWERPPNSDYAIGIAFVYAVAAACVLQPTTDRAMRYCGSAGALGVPGHAQAMCAAQAALLAVCVALPSVCVLRCDSSLAALAFLVGTVSVVAGHTRWTILLIVLGVAMSAVGRALYGSATVLFRSPFVQASVIIGGLASLGHWLRLPWELEGSAASAPVPAGHFALDNMSLPPGSSAEILPGGTTTLRDTSTGSLSPAGLGVGLGVDTVAVRQGHLLGLIAMSCLAPLWRLIQPVDPLLVYCLLLLVFAMYLGARVDALRVAWVSCTAEAEILSLTPFWPRGDQLKGLLLKTALLVQIEAWIVAGISTLAAVFLGWLPVGSVQICVLFIGASSLGSTLVLLLAAVRRAHKRAQPPKTALYVVGGAVGASLGFFRVAHGEIDLHAMMRFLVYLWWGFGILVLLALLALARFLRRPVRFPAELQRA
jgi:hypothetical protein